MSFPANGTWLSTTEFALCIIFFIICSTLVPLRLWSRTLSKGLRPHPLTLSDVFIAIGCLAALGNTCCDIAAVVAGGSGRHVDSVTNEEQITGQKSMFTAAFFWITATCTLKISILFLYTEIFSSRTPRMIAYGIITLVGMFFISNLLVIFLQCFPFSMNWLKDERGRCVNLKAESRAGAFINVTFDVMITIFPIPSIWQLQMPVRKRLYVIGIFGLGTAADGVNIARAVIAMNPSGPDYTYFSAKTNILSAMELWLGVIIACIPTLKPALSKMHLTVSTLASTNHSKSKTTRNNSSSTAWYSNRESDVVGSKSLGSPPATLVPKGLDSWERQYRCLNDSYEDVIGLRDMPRHGITDTTAQGVRAASSPTGLHGSIASHDIIKVRSDLDVYTTVYDGDEVERPESVAKSATHGTSMV